MKPPKEKNALHPPNTGQLNKFYKLPPTDQGIQTSTEMFTKYIKSKGYRHKNTNLN